MRKIPTLILLILFISASIASAAKIDSEKAKLKKIKDELAQKKVQLLETKKKEQKALSQLVLIKDRLKKTKRQLTKAKTRIAVNENQMGRLRVEIKETEFLLQQKNSKLKHRIREIYKNSSVNYLDLIFGAKNMSDFINRSYFFSKLVEKDINLINLVAEKHQEKKQKKTNLQSITSEIKDLAQTITVEKKKMDQEKAKEQQVYINLKDRRRDFEKRIAELEKSSEELAEIIQQSMANYAKRKDVKVGSGLLDWPLRGRISSRYGYRRHPYWGGRHLHTGIDIAVPYGRPIKAADGGEVILAKWWNGYGKAVVIAHGRNTSTVYGHLSRIYVQKGSKVSKGQIIGLVGSTGYSTGPHLHFEVRKNGKPTNPMKYLP
ncbi:murein hydrolase activator EnvC family protein [Candidatus Margulisiibacteriota bacterium]